MKTVIDLVNVVETHTYDAVGNRASVTYPNGTVAEYTYDSQNRLVTLFNHKSNGDTISCYTYTLGPAGNRILVTEHNGRTVDYTYDATYKLIQESIDDPDFGFRIISYTYDPVGNRLTKIDNSDTTTYIYDENDRLLTENSQLATRNYTYDNNGNTLTKTSPIENINYAYDYQNRLIRVDDGNSFTEYAYDTNGISVKKVVDGVNTVHYIVDKNRDYSQVLQERDGNGTVIVSYNYGDDLISQKRNSSLSYYHYDEQMSTRQLTDDSQNITDGYTYDAFGILLNKFGATVNNYLYTGEQYDPNVGFYYLRTRYYNPLFGRFLTMDTWPGNIFEPVSLHKYLYCESQPIGQWDPSGCAGSYTLIELNTTLYGRAIIGAALGGLGYLASWLGQGGNSEDFNKYDLLLSIAFGAAGNVGGGIFAASKATLLINVIMNAIISAIQYTSHYLWSGEDWNTWAFVLSVGFGGLAGLIAGRGAVGGSVNSLIRGGLGAISGPTFTALINGMKKYIEESTKPEYVQPSINLINHIFNTGPTIFKLSR